MTPAAASGPPRFGLATGGLPSTVELDRARASGCDQVELSLRCGQRDLVPRAAVLVEECRARELEPVVVLHVGGDAGWTDLGAPDRFRSWAAEVATALGGCRRWVPLARPNDEALRRRVRGAALSTRDLLRELDHQLAAHVLAADAIRAAVPSATVTFRVAPHRLYELDPMLLDVLLAPVAGVARDDLGAFLRDRRRAHDAASHQPVPPRLRLHRRLARSVVPLEQAVPRAVSAAYGAATRTVDAVRRDRRSPIPPVAPLALEWDEGPAGPAPPDADVVWRDAADGAFADRIARARDAAGAPA